MDHGSRIEGTVEEYRRGMMRLHDEYDEMKRKSSADNGAAVLEAIERAEAERDERTRLEAGERERAAAEVREQRDALARARVPRRSEDVVTPIDDDDPEGEYYRRESWLI
ncbi:MULTISPECIES: hypothetical protein [Nocardia]|uniref:hypothetical protein n=1 Tax=Nocardia TaxID=1817 RepID=UPI000D692D08|nr:MULTISPECIES: hypothetical protein [Nocardia]